jgi:hypothetical protein
MAILGKCDRCGVISDKPREWSALSIDANQGTSRAARYDLCPRCIDAFRDWLSPNTVADSQAQYFAEEA